MRMDTITITTPTPPQQVWLPFPQMLLPRLRRQFHPALSKSTACREPQRTAGIRATTLMGGWAFHCTSKRRWMGRGKRGRLSLEIEEEKKEEEASRNFNQICSLRHLPRRRAAILFFILTNSSAIYRPRATTSTTREGERRSSIAKTATRRILKL